MTELLTSTTDPPPAPDGLSERGTRFWDAVVGRYELRVDELEMLREAARLLGQIDFLAGELTGESMIVRGSMNQPAPHPLLAELRAVRSLLAQVLRQLKLPDQLADAAPAVETPTTIRARAAANARWSRERATKAAARG